MFEAQQKPRHINKIAVFELFHVSGFDFLKINENLLDGAQPKLGLSDFSEKTFR